MTGQEVIDLLKTGTHVNIEDSTGRWLHATALSSDGAGVDGYNQYGDPRTRGLLPDDEVNTYTPECNGCKNPGDKEQEEDDEE